MKDPYKILGVPLSACQEQVQRAYELLRMAFHPDHYDGLTHRARAREQFMAIEAAYRVLSDPERRREYDVQRVGRRLGNFGKAPAEIRRAPSESGVAGSEWRVNGE